MPLSAEPYAWILLQSFAMIDDSGFWSNLNRQSRSQQIPNMTESIVPECFYRINTSCAERWNVAGEKPDHKEERGGRREDERIQRRRAEEKARKQLARTNTEGHADEASDRNKPDSLLHDQRNDTATT